MIQKVDIFYIDWFYYIGVIGSSLAVQNRQHPQKVKADFLNKRYTFAFRNSNEYPRDQATPDPIKEKGKVLNKILAGVVKIY